MILLNALKMGLFAFKHPEIIQKNYFELLSQLLTLILEVAVNKKPRMCKLAIIQPEDNSTNEIVTIWAGAGIGANPTDRIRDLLAENEALKKELQKVTQPAKQNINEL